MPFNEQDPVRVKVPIKGSCVYTGRPASVPAGYGGTVVLATEGVSVYEVDFTVDAPGGGRRTAVLQIEESLLEPWE